MELIGKWSHYLGVSVGVEIEVLIGGVSPLFLMELIQISLVNL